MNGELLFFILGMITAIVIHIVFNLFFKKDKTCGVIEVDHNNELCKVHISSDELSDRKVKKAIFKIDHDADISRKEQIL